MKTIYDTIEYLKKGIEDLKSNQDGDYETEVSIKSLEKTIVRLKRENVSH